jgi:hypothetical protein
MNRIINDFNQIRIKICVLVVILFSAQFIFGNDYLISTHSQIFPLLLISYFFFGLFIIWITSSLNKRNLFVISVIFIFIIPYIFTSLNLLIIPEIFESIKLRKLDVLSSHELKHVAMMLIAFSSMYIGYIISKNNFKLKIYQARHKNEIFLNIYTFWLMVLIAISSVIILIKLDMYGFLANKVNFSEYISISEFLYVLGGFLKLSIILSLFEYTKKNDIKYLIITTVLVLINVLFGIISLY